MKQNDSAFDDRKKGQEAKYKMEEERRFKIRARRNKLVGLWIAERSGMDQEQAQAFAKDIVMAGLETPDDADLISRIHQVMAETGRQIPATDMAALFSEMEDTATRQIMDEFPSALDTDHGAVGDSPYPKE